MKNLILNLYATIRLTNGWGFLYKKNNNLDHLFKQAVEGDIENLKCKNFVIFSMPSN